MKNRNLRVLLVAVVLVPILLLALYYTHEDFWDKTSRQILRYETSLTSFSFFYFIDVTFVEKETEK